MPPLRGIPSAEKQEQPRKLAKKEYTLMGNTYHLLLDSYLQKGQKL